MNEARRVLRYVFPGLALILELSLYLLLCHTSKIPEFINNNGFNVGHAILVLFAFLHHKELFDD